MEPSSIQRKLAAILYADVAGYSRLTGADEEGTHRTLGTYLDAITAAIECHGGRVVHFAGDAVLADFPSVVAAVTCAVEVQEDLADRNQSLPEERKVRFRIGINLGEVMVDRNDIYGDGVNVAARLESLADVGGICVSGAVFDQVDGRLELGFEFQGKQTVKNIAEPVRAYRVRWEGDGAKVRVHKPRHFKRLHKFLVVAALAIGLVAVGMAFGWHHRAGWIFMTDPVEIPSIAVLPFDNLTGDADQVFLSDGLTEEIITALSKVRNLFVVARNSTFVYKGKPVKIQDVAKDLDVRYVLEGSVRRSADMLRITAQLIDAETGHHLWADNFDGPVDDLFAVQERITQEIVTALAVKLTEGEQVRVWRKHSRNLKAWEYLMRGADLFESFGKENNALARDLFEKAIEADRGYALGYAMLAWTHWAEAAYGWSDRPDLALEQAEVLAIRAGALDNELPDVHALQGAILGYREKYDEALAAARKAVDLNPNHATNTALLAMALTTAGEAEEGVQTFLRAIRLSPVYPTWYLQGLGWSHLQAEQFKEAIARFREYLRREPNTRNMGVYLGAALALEAIGRERRARVTIEDALKIEPTASVAVFRHMVKRRNPAMVDAWAAALKRIGLPE